MYYENDWGDRSTDYDEIMEMTIEHMSIEDLIDELQYYVSFDTILAMVVKGEDVNEYISGYIMQAQISFAEACVHTYNDDDEEDDSYEAMRESLGENWW